MTAGPLGVNETLSERCFRPFASKPREIIRAGKLQESDFKIVGGSFPGREQNRQFRLQSSFFQQDRRLGRRLPRFLNSVFRKGQMPVLARLETT